MIHDAGSIDFTNAVAMFWVDFCMHSQAEESLGMG